MDHNIKWRYLSNQIIFPSNKVTTYLQNITNARSLQQFSPTSCRSHQDNKKSGILECGAALTALDLQNISKIASQSYDIRFEAKPLPL